MLGERSRCAKRRACTCARPRATETAIKRSTRRPRDLLKSQNPNFFHKGFESASSSRSRSLGRRARPRFGLRGGGVLWKVARPALCALENATSIVQSVLTTLPTNKQQNQRNLFERPGPRPLGAAAPQPLAQAAVTAQTQLNAQAPTQSRDSKVPSRTHYHTAAPSRARALRLGTFCHGNW